MNSDDNVVERLRKRIAEARKMGFKVRMEVLDDEQAGWCQMGSSRFLFINLAQTAAEQLAGLDETLREFSDSVSHNEAAATSKSGNRAA